jgi:hypothetical protein
MGMQATGAGAGFGMAGLDTANKGLAGMNSGFGAGGSMAGNMGNNAAGMFNAQGNYKNQQDSNQGEQQGAMLGAGATVAAAMIMSDRRLKQDAVVVGWDATANLTLYEYAYKAHPDERYRGVMADEVLVEHPEAVVFLPNGFMAVDYSKIGVEFVCL